MLGPARYERREDDLYETPEWCTRVLLRHFSFGKIWEPAAGRGAMARVLAEDGADVAMSDLRGDSYGIPQIDFLAHRDPVARDIITNPPYSHADEFVRHALKLTEQSGNWVAMLLRNEWDTAMSRDDLFDEGSRFRAKVILTDRPRWIPGTTVRPRHAYAWYCWQGEPCDHPIILRGR